MRARRIAGLAIFLLVAAPARPALAGVCGCHEQSEGAGSDVVISDACFQPSLLHVNPGDEITFHNKDDFGHNVYGTGWAIGELEPSGGAGTASFADEGIYPFQCSLHPGMTGAVIVGDGEGTGNGVGVAIDIPEQEPPADTTTAAASPATEDEGGWLAAGIVGSLMGVAVGIGLMTLTTVTVRRRERLVSTPV